MKKLLAIVLSLLMVMSLAVPAMAVENTEKGTITVENAVKDVTYTAYRILDVETIVNNASDTAVGADEVKTDNNLVTYKVADSWANFFANDGAGKDYVIIDSQGYVTWNAGKSSAADVQAFAQAALVYATTNSIAGYNGTFTASDEDSETGTYAFANLPLGYYVIDSTLGTLCAIDTTTTNAVVKEKNEEPDLNKKVQEDSDNSWDKVNNAELGQDVNYEITVTIPKNIDKDVRVVDTLTGLTLKLDTIVVKDGGIELTKDTDYTVTTVDNKEFTITFDNNFLKANVAISNEIVITYTATVDATATIRGTGNPNEAEVQYGEGFTVSGEPSKTTTYVYDFLLKKYTGDPETLLAGAGFKLYKYDTDGITKLYATLESDPDPLKANTYKITGWDATGTEVMTDDTNRIKFVGLDADTYWLEETTVPAGYNKAEDTEVTFTEVLDNSSTAGVADNTADVFTDSTDPTIFNTAVKIVNNTGSELPETGGIGTTIFYVVGGLMMAVAVVLLVTKKKVNGK